MHLDVGLVLGDVHEPCERQLHLDVRLALAAEDRQHFRKHECVKWRAAADGQFEQVRQLVLHELEEAFRGVYDRQLWTWLVQHHLGPRRRLQRTAPFLVLVFDHQSQPRRTLQVTLLVLA